MVSSRQRDTRVVFLLFIVLGLVACVPAQTNVRPQSAASAPSMPVSFSEVNTAPRFAGEMVAQLGHTQEISDIVYASNGRFIVTSARDGKVKLWTPDGRLLRTLTSYSFHPRIALSPDDALIAIASGGGVLELWSVAGKRLKFFPRMKVVQFSALAFSPDQRYLVACSRVSKNDHCQLFNLQGESLVAIKNPAQGQGTIIDAAVSAQGKSIFIAAHRSVYKFNESGELETQFKVTDGFLSAMALSPDGQRLATAVAYNSPAMDQRLGGGKLFTHLWDSNGNRIVKFKSHSTRDLSFSRDGQWLISGGVHDNRVLIHDRDGKHIRTLQFGRYRVTSPAHLALSPDRRLLVTADHRFKPVALKVWRPDGTLVREFNQFGSAFINMAAAPHSNVFVTTSTDNQIRFWSLDGRLLTRFPAQYEYPSLLAVAPNGRYFVSGGTELNVWNGQGEKITSVSVHNKGGRAVAFTADGKQLLTGGADGYVNIVPLDAEGSAKRFKPHDGKEVKSLAAHPNGRVFATGSIWERVGIWDMDGKQVASFAMPKGTKPPFSSTYAMQFTPDGQYLVVATTRKDHQLRVLDLKGNLVRSIATGNRDQGGSLTISARGRWLAASVGNKIGVWDLASWALRGYLKGHQGSVRAMSFSNDEQHLVSASADGTMRVWNMDNGQSFAMQSGKDEWVIYTNDGYFDASRYGGDLVAMVDGLRAYGVDQVALHYNRPDLIYRRVAVGDDAFINHFYSHYRKRLSQSSLMSSNTSDLLSAPEVKLINSQQIDQFLDMEFEVSDRHHRVVAIQLYANNVPLFAGTGKSIDDGQTRFRERLELTDGENKIEVSAFNELGVESLRAQVVVNYRSRRKGDLYFIGLGVSQYRDNELNLRYAHKDVQDMEALLLRYRGHFDQVHSLALTDSDATRDALLKAQQFLATATVDDTVIMLASGHGSYDLGENASYYYISHEADVNDLPNTAIAFADLESLLSDIAPRKKLLLLDTCESGEMDPELLAKIHATAGANNLIVRTSQQFRQRSLTQRRTYLYARNRYIYNNLSRRTGTIVFSSSLANELSLESSAIENGVFTEALLQVLTMPQADTNQDGFLSIRELETGVKALVASATHDVQHPEITRENIYQDFKLPLLKN